MTLRAARIAFALAALGLAWPAAAQNAPRTSDPGPNCANTMATRDPLTNPEARRGTMDEQFCTQLDRQPDGRSIELYGGTVDGGQRRVGDAALNRPRDELEHQEGFFGLRLRVPLGF